MHGRHYHLLATSQKFFPILQTFFGTHLFVGSSFFRSKADALTRAMKIEQKMSKNFCEHYEHGEYALMKEWHDNLWNIIKKSAHL